MASSLAYMLLSSILLILSGRLIHLNVTVPEATCEEFVSSFFESHQGHALLGHVINVCTGNDLVCGLECLRNGRCRSYNCFPAENQSAEICHLNNETRTSRPKDFKGNQRTTYFELMQIANSNFVCENDGRWSSHQNYCKCRPGYKGITCSFKKLGFSSSFPGHSCKDIWNSGDSEGDGEYWIDPEKNGNPLLVYCDMTTDGGGWLLVVNLLTNSSSPPPSWTPETSYSEITHYHNNRMGITTSAMKELRAHLNFTQIRFHCSKQQGNTFHVTTVANSTGEAVVQYFSGQTNILPSSCNSYQRLDGDDSELATQCDKWGNDHGSHHVGKWGHYNKRREDRMYDHTAFIAHKNHWVVVHGIWLCDDVGSDYKLSLGDFWKIYVR